MKVSEIFESKSYYLPSYKKELGIVRGAVTDWLNRLGIEQGDLSFFNEALDKLKKTQTWKDALELGLEFNSTDRELQNGTLSFKQNIKYSNGKDTNDNYVYKIYGNGQIRQQSNPNYFTGKIVPYRLKSPKPKIVAGNPLKTMVSLWENALKEVINKFEKKLNK
jgi:hypothetical protein